MQADSCGTPTRESERLNRHVCMRARRSKDSTPCVLISICNHKHLRVICTEPKIKLGENLLCKFQQSSTRFRNVFPPASRWNQHFACEFMGGSRVGTSGLGVNMPHEQKLHRKEKSPTENPIALLMKTRSLEHRQTRTMSTRNTCDMSCRMFSTCRVIAPTNQSKPWSKCMHA